jgi:hypothetical protein
MPVVVEPHISPDMARARQRNPASFCALHPGSGTGILCAARLHGITLGGDA